MKQAYLMKVVVVILAVLSVLIAARVSIQNNARIYIYEELARIGARQTVIIRGVSYEVQSGVLSSPTQAERPNEAAILRLAYAQELARQAPMLGIEGTDPATLRENTTTLARAVSVLADAQTSTSSSTLIRSLYPIEFLLALADAEAKRKEFLRAGSDVNESRYDAALRMAIEAGAVDARSFAIAFDAATADASTTKFSTFGGTISRNGMSRAIDDIRKRFQETRDRYERQRRCLDYYTFACRRGMLDVTIPDLPSLAKNIDVEAQSVRSILARANPASFLPRRHEIVLNASTCMALVPGPYHFLITRPEYMHLFFPPLYINEIFFSSTSRGNGPVLSYLKKVHGIELVPFNPMNFYGCPELGADIATMRAVIYTASIAQTYPEIAPQERDSISGTLLREDSARAYLQAAYASSVSDNAARNEIIAASLMFTEQSAGLDDLVGQIADIMARDEQLKGGGAPFDNSVQTLFLTHSAFPSLFLAHNPSAGLTRVTLTEPNRANFLKLLNQYSTYTSIKESVSRAKILHDIRSFYDFENIAQSAIR